MVTIEKKSSQNHSLPRSLSRTGSKQGTYTNAFTCIPFIYASFGQTIFYLKTGHKIVKITISNYVLRLRHKFLPNNVQTYQNLCTPYL
jgi:hypothetical protein